MTSFMFLLPHRNTFKQMKKFLFVKYKMKMTSACPCTMKQNDAHLIRVCVGCVLFYKSVYNKTCRIQHCI